MGIGGFFGGLAKAAADTVLLPVDAAIDVGRFAIGDVETPSRAAERIDAIVDDVDEVCDALED